MSERIKAADYARKAVKAKPVDREGPIHRSIIAHLRKVLPGAVVHHSPGEFGVNGKEIARQIAKNKKNGMLVGFPDVLTFWQGRAFVIEVKVEGNGLSKPQKALRAEIEAQGIPYAVCRSTADVDEFLAEIGAETGGE